MERTDVERRVGLLFLLVAVLFSALGLRLAHLQLVKGEAYEVMAEGNRLRILPITAPRGQIYDARGRLLATNRPAFAVSLLYMGVRELDRSIDLLAGILRMSKQEINDKIEQQRGRWYEPIRLRLDVPSYVYTQIEEHKHELPGVVVEALPVREYPEGRLAAHVLGYLGEIELSALERLGELGYSGGDIVGKMGIEAAWDIYLRGTNGGQQVEVDSLGRPVRVLGQIDPVPGHDIYLTVDMDLQRATEQALERVLLQLQEDERNPMPRAKIAAAAAIDPNSGAILAMSSRPSFDPNLFAAGISARDWQAIESDPLLPLLNRAILGEYQPGSSFKMITAIAALETKNTWPGELLDCQGGVYRVSQGESKRCWAVTYGGHGRLLLTRAIGESCNVVFYELGRRVGIDDLGRYAREFGLGSPTGLTDIAGERSGLAPSRAWKKENYPNESQWWLSETLDAAIGQGFHLYTPIQMAVYASMLANCGVRYRPYLVREIVDHQGQTTCAAEPERLSVADVSAETFAIIREGMLLCTTGAGTAASAFAGFPISVAGKTGTVEFVTPNKDNHGWFVGYAPANNPQIAVAVIVEQGGGGGRAAAPIARAILEEYFRDALESTSPQ